MNTCQAGWWVSVLRRFRPHQSFGRFRCCEVGLRSRTGLRCLETFRVRRGRRSDRLSIYVYLKDHLIHKFVFNGVLISKFGNRLECATSATFHHFEQKPGFEHFSVPFHPKPSAQPPCRRRGLEVCSVHAGVKCHRSFLKKAWAHHMSQTACSFLHAAHDTVCHMQRKCCMMHALCASRGIWLKVRLGTLSVAIGHGR